MYSFHILMICVTVIIPKREIRHSSNRPFISRPMRDTHLIQLKSKRAQFKIQILFMILFLILFNACFFIKFEV